MHMQFWLENITEREHLGNVRVDGNIRIVESMNYKEIGLLGVKQTAVAQN